MNQVLLCCFCAVLILNYDFDLRFKLGLKLGYEIGFFVLSLMSVFFGIVLHIGCSCSEKGDTILASTSTEVIFFHCFIFNFWVVEVCDFTHLITGLM